MSYLPGVAPEAQLSGSPRVQFASADGSRFVLFQEDRFSYGWHRQSPLDEDPNYPGFDTVLQDAEANWRFVRKWIKETFDLEVVPDVLEIAYADAFETHDSKGEPIPLAETFTFLNSVGTRMLSFEYKWMEPLADPLENGFASVTVQGPALTVYGRSVTTMASTASFKAGPSWEDIGAQFDRVHANMNEVFQRLVKQPFDTKL